MLPINILEALVDEPDSGILRVCDEIHVAIYPHFINNIRLGLINYLNRQINQWHPKLKGILVAYDSLKVHLSTAFVENEELHLDVVANFWVFRPMVGKQLKGVVLKKSDSHISCLVNGAFVVSCFKPTNIDQDVSWFGAKINQGKTVRFNVLKTDMSQQIPFIVGELVGIESEDQLENFVQVVEDKNEWEKIQSLTRKIKSQASKSGENDSDDKSARKKRKQEEMESSQDQILKQETDRKKKKNKKDKDREEEKSLLTSQKSNEDQQEQQRKEEKEKKKLAKKEKLAIGKEDEDLMQNGALSLSKNVKASNGENPVLSDVEMKAENKKKEKNEEAELCEIERRKQLLIEKIGANINAKKKKKRKNRDEENNDNEQEPDRSNSASDNAELDDEDKRQRQLLIDKIGANINAKKKKKKKNRNEENPEDNEHCKGKKNDKKEVETEENLENAEDTEDSKEKKKVKTKVETEVNLKNADGNEQESDRANLASENAELEDEVERQKQLLIEKIGTNINAKKKKKMKNSAEENPQDNERSKEKKNDKQEVEMEENLENAKDTEQSKEKKKDKRKVETKENPENPKDNEHSKEKKKGKRKIEIKENLENTDDNEQASDRANSASEKAELDDAVERQKQLLIENIGANVNAKKKNKMKNRDEENPEDNEHSKEKKNNKQAIETEENPENAKDTDHTKEKKNGKRKMETEENPENAKDNEHSKEKKKGKRKVETEENPENADEQESDRANSASENADEEVNRKPKNGKGRKQKATDSQIPELPVPQFDQIESKMMKHKEMVKELGDGAPSFMVPTSTPTSNGKPSEMHQNEIVSSLIANLLKNQKTNKTKKSK